MTPDTCTHCSAPRPKHARWYWVDSNARPPVVYCPPCAKIKALESVARRREANREQYARAGRTRAKRSA